MSLPPLHPWTLDPEEALRLQERLREQLRLRWDGRPVATVGGVDVHLAGEQGRAAIVVLSFPQLSPLTAAVAETPLRFPYIPGLLAFREGPAVLAAWERLTIKPDLLLFDGQGIAHPRRLGIAAHLGLWLGTPSIGVAKSRLYGRHAAVGERPGDRAELWDEGDPTLQLGFALRTRERCNPLYVSPGHLIDLEHALAFTLACVRGYRLPEPTRRAHLAASIAPPPPHPAQGRLW